jgi:hypothetical protein
MRVVRDLSEPWDEDLKVIKLIRLQVPRGRMVYKFKTDVEKKEVLFLMGIA